MSKREGFFECVFASEGNEYQFHFRAWNEAEAERHLRETLSGYGVSLPGTLLIRDHKGHIVRKAQYAPSPAKEASP